MVPVLMAIQSPAIADFEDECAPNTLLIRFKPGVVSFPLAIDRGHNAFRASLANAEFSLPGLRTRLEDVRVADFETVAATWRHLTAADSLDRFGRRVELVDFTDLYRVSFEGSIDLEATIELLRGVRGVAHVECDRIIGLDFFTPNDEYYPDAWHLHNTGQVLRSWSPDSVVCDTFYDINAPEAWDLWDSAGTKIGIFDNGLDSSHADLGPYIDHSLSWSFDPILYHWSELGDHGTWVAGLALAGTNNDSVGVAGVSNLAPNHSDDLLVALRVKHGGLYEDVLSNVIDAVAYTCSSGVYPQILATNHAWGAAGCLHWKNSHSYPTGLRDAFRNAFLKDISLVCSAGQTVGCSGSGSGNDECWLFPAAYLDYSLAIAAVRCNGDTIAANPMEGSYIDLTAPGGIGMPTTSYGGGYLLCEQSSGCHKEGTSAAAPVVSGAIALLLGKDHSLTNEDCYHLLEVTAVEMEGSPMSDSLRGGHGLVKLDRALSRLKWPWELRRDSCTTYTSDSIDARWKEFRNVDLGQEQSESWDSAWVHVYELECLSPKLCTATQTVDTVWVRGKYTTGWKDLNKYDAYFHANYAEFVEWQLEDQAKFRTYTNRVYTEPGGDFIGWRPFEPGVDSFRVHFTTLAKYNADTMGVGREPLASGARGVFPLGTISFTGETKLSLAVDHTGYYTLAIYDVAGRVVARPMHHSLLIPGRQVHSWDGRGRDAVPVATGIYCARLWRDGKTRRPYGSASRFVLLR